MKLQSLNELQDEHKRILSLPEYHLSNEVDTPHLALLNNIHSTNRTYTNTRYFGEPSRVCLLDFIDAPDFFISEYGTVWNRNRIFPNKLKRLTKGYLPMSVLDSRFPYPWVKIPCALNSADGVWLPLNFLLAWAFNPTISVGKYYAVAVDPSKTPLSSNQLFWSTQPSIEPSVSSLPSRYLTFIDELYSGISS